MLGPDPAKRLPKYKFTRSPINVAGMNHYPAALANSCAIELKLLSIYVAIKNLLLLHDEPTVLDLFMLLILKPERAATCPLSRAGIHS